VSEERPSKPDGELVPHRRRPRYSGKHPREFSLKYKERESNPETIAKVLASGKTPAGTHRPIMVAEVLEVLAPRAGEIGADCTLGYGGHARELLARLLPGGRLIGLDADPIELPKTEARLRALGFGADVFSVCRSNFAGLGRILGSLGLPGVDVLLADLGVSSMQLDDPARGFSMKSDGPLDMRMNPQRGQPASALLAKANVAEFQNLLREHADEPHAAVLSAALAGKQFPTTRALAIAVRSALPRVNLEDREMAVRRVFQALRIWVNDEFSALDSFLRQVPHFLNQGGRAAIITFHSGEDRRVKKAFLAGFREGVYEDIAQEVIRPAAAERNANPRSAPAKLRWARKTVDVS
jgi:16S rRNA (cytosine1402-N4)-methyltransferase